MADNVVNLNRARKAKARLQKAKTAEQNRIKHGTPPAERKRLAAEKKLRDGKLDGHKLDPDT